MGDLKLDFLELADQTRSLTLPPPHELRRRGDRRTRLRTAAVCGVALVLIGGLLAAVRTVPTGDQVTPPAQSAAVTTPAATPLPTPTSEPSVGSTPPSASAPSAGASTGSSGSSGSSGPAVPTSIPASAFLQPEDTGGGDHVGRAAPTRMLPSLCGASYASDPAIQARRATLIVYWEPGTRELGQTPGGTLEQTITTYRSDGAARFMGQLRSAVAACPSQLVDGTRRRMKLLTPIRRGDDALLLEVRYPTIDGNGTSTGREEVRLVSVVRIGATVTVLHEQGYEAGWSADPVVVDGFTAKAVTRLRSWLR